MKYKTLVIERGVRGGRFKKPLTLRVPERQNGAEKKLLRYIWESLSRRSPLIPFTLKNFSTMEVARHLLFNRTGSQFTLYEYVDDFNCFCRWIKAEPDQLMSRCRKSNGDANPKGIARMTSALDEYIDQLQAKNLSPTTIRSRLKNITSVFRINGVGLRLPYGLSVWNLYNERAPSREELIKILDLADLRERVIITTLAVSGLRVGTLLRLQYRHVKDDLERDIIPIHIHVESELIKGKRRSYDTFLNDEASECLRAYFKARKIGTKKIPPEQIRDESPLIRTCRCKQVKTVAVTTVHQMIHNLYVRTGLLEKNSLRRRYELRTHSFRRFFRTQMASLEVDPDCIDFMMGRAVKDRYHDVRMKGVEYLRGVYTTSGIRIRPRIKMNKIDALKEILQTWGLNPQKILTREALTQITPTTKQEQADNRDTLISSKASQNYQRSGSLPESTGAYE
ncbi:MAG: site-specific integrase [Candidatus Bathyarchaeia archaeon]